MSAIEAAELRGHVLNPKPTTVIGKDGDGEKWWCTRCSAAVVSLGGNVYGLAVEVDCKPRGLGGVA